MIYHIYANQSNVGDWLSARGIQSLLAPWPVQELFCDEPFVEETMTALSEAGPDDFIIIGGGGLFMDYFTGFWESFRRVAPRVPFCVWGAGCCDMKRQQSRPPQKLIREVIRHSQFCSVRDELSRDFVGDYSHPTAVPCPSLAAISATDRQQARLLYVDHYDVVGPVVYEQLVATAQHFAKETGRSYRQTNNRIQPGRTDALLATLNLYASAEMVLTSRLHGCIIALALGRPVLAVSGDHKLEGFMAAAGLRAWVYEVSELDHLPARLRDLPTQPAPGAFLEWARQENRRIADAVRRLVPATQALALT